MEETKVCSRCGKEKSVDDFYSVKYRGQKPRYKYSICKTCTSIESRRRYLAQTDPTNPLLDKIDALYEKHRAAGRSVPETGTRRSGSEIEAEIDELLQED